MTNVNGLNVWTLAETLQTCQPMAFGPLVLFPLRIRVDVIPDIVPLPGACQSGHVTISELRRSPTVDFLCLNNGGHRPVFAPAGIILSGLAQNRLVARGVVVNPGRQVRIASLCVEQNRWADEAPETGMPSMFAPISVRRAQTRAETGAESEAVLSSQIEGTQSSLSDLLLFEADGTPDVSIDDVREVANYVAAIDHGIERLREGFPLSLRLLNEIHGILLSKGRGSDKTPGEFRRSQNWIGGDRPGNAAFVPPPPDVLIECMGALEKFLHDDPVKTPVLMKAALAHVQFETIHPYLDGNGRLGLLLITLILCSEGVLSEPLLYLSLHFKRNPANILRPIADRAQHRQLGSLG
jgi:hypothetical protein